MKFKNFIVKNFNIISLIFALIALTITYLAYKVSVVLGFIIGTIFIILFMLFKHLFYRCPFCGCRIIAHFNIIEYCPSCNRNLKDYFSNQKRPK